MSAGGQCVMVAGCASVIEKNVASTEHIVECPEYHTQPDLCSLPLLHWAAVSSCQPLTSHLVEPLPAAAALHQCSLPMMQ
jgi:hypothetical protein